MCSLSLRKLSLAAALPTISLLLTHEFPSTSIVWRRSANFLFFPICNLHFPLKLIHSRLNVWTRFRAPDLCCGRADRQIPAHIKSKTPVGSPRSTGTSLRNQSGVLCVETVQSTSMIHRSLADPRAEHRVPIRREMQHFDE